MQGTFLSQQTTSQVTYIKHKNDNILGKTDLYPMANGVSCRVTLVVAFSFLPQNFGSWGRSTNLGSMSVGWVVGTLKPYLM